MNTKFEDFIEEGLGDKIKGFFNPTTEQIMQKADDKINQFDKLCRRAATYSDVDSFITYVDYCGDVLNVIKKLEKRMNKIGTELSPTLIEPIIHDIKKKKDIRDKENIEKFIIKSLDAIANTWPKRVKFTTCLGYFIDQLRNILITHEELAEEYGTTKIETTKFRRT